MVEETKVTRNYQITIPATIREKLGIRVGDKLILYTEGDKIILVKKKGDLASLNLKLGRKFTDEEVNKVIVEAGEEVGGSG
ncbi:AbrB family transcriptional regulator [Sulfolobus acidocaldarius SUSAZ]|nr:AbrB family transcriptional regulator [Sulfolobus acidocaldarius SUSAZ]